jgi:outer membrane PBP1 activator LpoA protein
MRIKSITGLIAAAALGLLAGCGTPCGTNGGLCAPAQANTSAAPAVRPLAAPAPPVPNVPPVPNAPSEASPPPEASATVPEPAAEALPSSPPATITRIGLLLPLRSETLGQAAEAVRDGFMAAYERDRTGFVVDLIATGGTPQEALDAYRQAAIGHDILVGPLTRPAVTAVATSTAVSRPTLALNYPDTPVDLPRQMLLIGLSIEDEARQVAQWAGSEHPGGRALVLAGPAAWQQRIARAFEARWSQLGRTAQRVELPVAGGYVDPAAIAELRTRLEIDRPDLLFAATDAGELRQLRGALGTAIPCYGTSSLNPGGERGAAVPELDGVRLLDLPWQVQPAHAAVMVYPRWLASGSTPDMDRLYALGIDAFRVARETALRPRAAFTLDGVTGKLSVSVDPPGFARSEAPVVYRDGNFEPAAAR